MPNLCPSGTAKFKLPCRKVVRKEKRKEEKEPFSRGTIDYDDNNLMARIRFYEHGDLLVEGRGRGGERVSISFSSSPGPLLASLNVEVCVSSCKETVLKEEGIIGGGGRCSVYCTRDDKTNYVANGTRKRS